MFFDTTEDKAWEREGHNIGKNTKVIKKNGAKIHFSRSPNRGTKTSFARNTSERLKRLDFLVGGLAR